MENPFLSVIIPCYNEKENLERGVLCEIEEYLKKQKYSYEIIISDDESTDESREIVKNFIKNKKSFRLIENTHGGKPFALRSGTQQAKGEVCLFTDMDQSSPINELEKILPYFGRGFNVVIGSRGTQRKDFSWYRQLMSLIFRLIRQTILLRNILDTQCGFKACKTDTGRDIFSKMTIFKKRGSGWKVGAWDVEFLFVAEKLGYKTKEISVEWKDMDITKGKKKNFIKESKDMFFEVLRVRINDLKKRYE